MPLALVESPLRDCRARGRRTPEPRRGGASPADVVEIVHARTEGWVTGLRLTALPLQRTEFALLLVSLDTFEFWFTIVTPWAITER